MTNVIDFPEKKIPYADKLLQQFVAVCQITDKEERKKQYKVLRLAIFTYVISRK